MGSPKLWLRHGGGVPSYDLPAKVDLPKGLRLKGPVATQGAYRELKDRGFLSGPRLLELGQSFYTIKSRHGASLNGVLIRDKDGVSTGSQPLHTVVSLEALPRCRALLHHVLDLLGLEKSKLKDSLANGMARRYKPGSNLPRHVDNTEMFQEPVVAIVLKSSPRSGLRLCTSSGRHGAATSIIAEAGGALEGDPLANFRVEPGYQIEECDGMVVSFEGAARYDFAHEVPPVSSTRVSLTWRWFDEDFLERLYQREAALEDSMTRQQMSKKGQQEQLSVSFACC